MSADDRRRGVKIRIVASDPHMMVKYRDVIIDALAPERECSDMPGLYRLPNGRTMTVLAGEVTFYEKEDE